MRDFKFINPHSEARPKKESNSDAKVISQETNRSVLKDDVHLYKKRQTAENPHQRACESEHGYDWRTDPYYNEESIRERLKASKAKILPASVFDSQEPPAEEAEQETELQASPQERIAAGESKSKAYRDSDTHTQGRADRDAEVLALHEQGENKSEIHRETGVPRKTVSDIIKRYEQGGENSQSTINSTLGKSATPTNPVNTDVEQKTLYLCESEPDHDTFFKLLDISACFYEKHQLSPSEVSQFTGIDESEVCRILADWYQAVVISPGIGETYWMTERDEKNFTDKILAPTHRVWEQNFPGQKILCPPTLFNPNLNANASER